MLSVFYSLKDADSYAKHISAQFPGYDVYIYEQSYGYTAKTVEPAKKQWDKDGNYLPVKEA